MDDFLVLFLLHRILANDDTVCKQVITSFSEDDAELQITCDLKEYGIKQYMNCYYQDTQHDSVQSIHNQLISQFDGEWKQLQQNLKSYLNKNIKPFEYKLFNQRDIVPYIFQFNDLKSLCSASLVNVTWLFNAFNSNSIYFINLAYLMSNKVQSQLPWRRCSMARHIELFDPEIVQPNRTYQYDQDDHPSLSILVKRIQLFTKMNNVTLVLCRCPISVEQYFDQVWKVFDFLCKISHQFRKFEIFISPIEHRMETMKYFEKMKKNVVSKQASNESIIFDLRNAKFVSCNGVLIPVRISDKCETLQVGLWCIDDTSDFGGVNNLILTNMNSLRDTSITPSKLASKFNDIKFFAMKDCFPNNNVIMFWQAISKKIRDNNGKIRLSVKNDFEGVSKLNRWLKKLKDIDQDMIDGFSLHQLVVEPFHEYDELSELLVGKQAQSEKIRANMEWLCFRLDEQNLNELTDFENGRLNQALGCFFTKLAKLECFCVSCNGQISIASVGRYFEYICTSKDLYINAGTNESAMNIGFKAEFKVFAGTSNAADKDVKSDIMTFFHQLKKLMNKMIAIDIKVSFCIFKPVWRINQVLVPSIEQQTLQKKLINDSYEKFKFDCVKSPCTCPQISGKNQYWTSIKEPTVDNEDDYDEIFLTFRIKTANYITSDLDLDRW